MTRYVTARHNDLERLGFRNYLYGNQEVVSGPTPDKYGQMALIKCPDDYLADMLRDRLSSGMMGARTHDTLEDAETYMLEWQD